MSDLNCTKRGYPALVQHEMLRSLLLLWPIILVGALGNICTLYVLVRAQSTAIRDVRFYFLFVFGADLLVQIVAAIKLITMLPLSSELHLILNDIICRVQR